MKKEIKWLLIAGIIGAGVATTYYTQRPKIKADKDISETQVKESQKKKSEPLNVIATVIRPEMLVDEFNTTGVLLPDEMVDLSFESDGQVVEINFEEGTRVKQGDLLARINDSELQAKRQRLTAQLKLAQDRVYRQRQLLARDAVSREALEQVQTDLATLQADINIVEAQIELTRLYAPFDGIIGLRKISLGQYASTSTEVARLTKNTPLKIEFSIPERYAKHIGKGSNLTFTVEGDLTRYEATVYAGESVVDPELHQFTLRAIFPNKNEELMAGRFALVELKKDEISDAISIVPEAIVPEMGRDKVYLFRSGKAEPVEIETGIRTANRVQIVEGLSVGDTLIVSGTLQLRTGLDVVIDELN